MSPSSNYNHLSQSSAAPEQVLSYDALPYEPTEYHTMSPVPNETITTPEAQPRPGEWEQSFLQAVTPRVYHFRMLTLAEHGNEEARQRLMQGVTLESQQQTQADMDLAA